MRKIIIFGTGRQSKLVLSQIDTYHFKEIIFFNDKDKQNKTITYNKKKLLIIKKYEELKKKIDKNTFGFIGIGSNLIRKKIIKKLKLKSIDLKWLKIISNKTNIHPSVIIGEGSLVMPGVTINNNSVIGNHCLINTNSSIDHDNKFGDFVSTGPGVNTAGNVSVESFCHLGIGSNIKENINIKKNTIIGGGSFVNKNCNQNSLYFGVPAKKIKKK